MKRILFVGLLLIAGFLCKGQVQAGKNIISVNPFTGIGSAYVPIYPMTVDDIDAGIGLSYDTKGVRVDDIASSVGLGWQLSAGGSITREVRGVEDEITVPSSFAWLPNPTPNMDDTLQGMLVPGGLYQPRPYPAYDYRFDDTDPDIFNLQIGSRSVRFSYQYNSPHPTYVYATDPKSEIKIELVTKDWVNGQYTNERAGVVKNIGADSFRNILSFVVTDEKGNIFYFDRGDYERKRAVTRRDTPFKTITDTVFYYATDKWDLQKVVTAGGHEINYSYINKYVEKTTGTKEAYQAWSSPQLSYEQVVWKGWETHIAKIAYPGRTEVLFDLDTSMNGRCDCQGAYRLKNIKVQTTYKNGDKNSLTYRFNQAYFNSPTSWLTPAELPVPSLCSGLGAGSWTYPSGTTQTEKDKAQAKLLKLGARLKLKGIDRIGTDNSTTEKHFSFDYNTTPLPYRLSPAKDFYGYHNGKSAIPVIGYNSAAWNWSTYNYDWDTFAVSIPRYWEISVGADRSYDFAYAQSSVLNKITNGLGGVTAIDYANYSLENPACSYGDIVNHPSHFNPLHCNIDPKLMGDTANDGLVISKITTKDAFNQEANATTEYTYKNGKRFFRGGYMWHGDANKTYVNNFITAPEFFQNSNHGFDTAIITVKGYNNEWISTQKLTYSNLMYDSSGVSVSCLRLPTGNDYRYATADFRKSRMGLVLRSDAYDEYGNHTSAQLNNYRFLTNPDEIVASGYTRMDTGYLFNIISDNPSANDWYYHVIGYELPLLDSSTTIRYEQNPVTGIPKEIKTGSKYDYDGYANLKRVTWKDSKGDVFKRINLYNYDYTYLASVPSTNAPVEVMTNDSLQYVLSDELWKKDGSDSVLLSYTLNTPSYNHSPRVVSFTGKFTSMSDIPISSSQAYSPVHINREFALGFPYTNPVGFNFKQLIAVTRQDSKYNAIESLVPGEDLYEAKIMDTSINQVVATISNARYEDVAYSSFEELPDQNHLSQHRFGNWRYDATYMKAFNTVSGLSKGLTGKYVYQLNASANSMLSDSLNAIPYLLTFWAYAPSNAGLSVSCNAIGPLTPVLRRTVGQWKFYTVEFTPPSAKSLVEIYNQGGVNPVPAAYLDEVRLHPVGAEMSSATYKPFLGVGSACDPYNEVMYFEYDAFGALKIERDINGNVKRKTEYVNQQAAGSPAPVPQTTY